MPNEGRESIEAVADPARRTVSFLQKTGFIDNCSSRDKFQNWLSNQTNEQLADFLVRLNGLLTNTPIKDREVTESQMQVGNALATIFNAPYPEQKAKLLDMSIDGIRQLEDPKRKALLAYTSLQALHLFSDGNGRTGRLLYYLFSNIGTPEAFQDERLHNLISHQTSARTGTEGRKLIEEDIIPIEDIYGLVTAIVLKPELLGPGFDDYLYVSSSQAIGVIESSLPHIHNPMTKKEVKTKLSDFTGRSTTSRLGIALGDLATLSILEKKGLLATYRIKNKTLERKATFAYDGAKFFDQLDDATAREILDAYEQIKLKFFESLIKILASSDQENANLVDAFFRSPED